MTPPSVVSRCVWVLAHDGGCEGYSGPVQAFATKLEALAGQALSKAAGNTLALFLVPMWPNVADVGWSAVKPWEASDDQPFSIEGLGRKAGDA